MKSFLKKEFELETPILPLHDRPASHFSPILDPNARAEFLATLPETKEVRSYLTAGTLRVLVSSTSWTADEDFSVLIDALLRYSELATTTQLIFQKSWQLSQGKVHRKRCIWNKLLCWRTLANFKRSPSELRG
jgi:beta-1,4-mannosyltransferase